MSGRAGIIIEGNRPAGERQTVSVPDKTSHTQAASTYVYAHQPGDPVLDEKRFTTSSERTLDYKGRTVLYTYAEASAISFCSASGASYAGNMMVRGYVVRWQYGRNDKGEAISEVEPITDKAEQEEISRILWPGMSSMFRVSFRAGPSPGPGAA
jgi:hypothetical protein